MNAFIGFYQNAETEFNNHALELAVSNREQVPFKMRAICATAAYLVYSADTTLEDAEDVFAELMDYDIISTNEVPEDHVRYYYGLYQYMLVEGLLTTEDVIGVIKNTSDQMLLFKEDVLEFITYAALYIQGDVEDAVMRLEEELDKY